MFQEGIVEPVIKDCDSIMLSEVSEFQTQFNALQHKIVSLLDTLRSLEVGAGCWRTCTPHAGLKWCRMRSYYVLLGARELLFGSSYCSLLHAIRKIHTSSYGRKW